MPERPHPDLGRVRDALTKRDVDVPEPAPEPETPPEDEEDDGEA